VIEIRQIGPDDWKLLRATRLAALQDAPEAFESTYEGSLAFGEDEWRRRAGDIPSSSPSPVRIRSISRSACTTRTPARARATGERQPVHAAGKRVEERMVLAL